MTKQSNSVLSDAQQAQLDALLAAAPDALGIGDDPKKIKVIHAKIVQAFMDKVHDEQSKASGKVRVSRKKKPAHVELDATDHVNFDWSKSVERVQRRVDA